MRSINVDSTIHPRDLLSAKQAADRLGIKLQTLYAYASRGLLRSLPGTRDRSRLYLRSDIERLAARQKARSGHGPVAAGALRWGEPVLDSAITAIDPRGPRYRGHLALDLAGAGRTFEDVAELLWTGELPDAEGGGARRFVDASSARERGRIATFLGPQAAPMATLSIVVPAIAARDGERFGASHEEDVARARGLVAAMAASLALHRAPRERSGARHEPTSIAGLVAESLAGRSDGAAVRALDLALVLVADHELNVSSFAARVAASAGADLYASVTAALATLSGPLHGGACDRVEALVAEAGAPDRARTVVQQRTRRGESVPGFGHPLYPSGDPRTPPLLAAARALAPKDARVATLLALCDAMAKREPATVDLGLVGLALALGMPPGSAAGLFAVGRAAGWIAHAFEQREAGFLLRPRARYVGPGAVRGEP